MLRQLVHDALAHSKYRSSPLLLYQLLDCLPAPPATGWLCDLALMQIELAQQPLEAPPAQTMRRGLTPLSLRSSDLLTWRIS